MKNNFFYKNLEFNAIIFKTDNGLFFLPTEYAFYSSLAKALKTIPNNPKKTKSYTLLAPTKNLKNNISRELIPFEMVEFIFKEELADNLMIIEDEKKIILHYNKEFIKLMENATQTLQWDSPYGEVCVEGIIFCPDWW